MANQIIDPKVAGEINKKIGEEIKKTSKEPNTKNSPQVAKSLKMLSFEKQ